MILLAGLTTASARESRQLDEDDLQSEMNRNRALASYVGRNGMPDVAASHFLSDEPPWDDHEVTLYYLKARKEIAFARAYVLGEPSVHVIRYERPLTDADIAALQPMVGWHHGTGEPGDPVARAEEAARRAEAAAGRVDAAAVVADRAADRAEAVVAKMETSFHRSLLK
jgi:hypothetical protein